MNLPIDLSPSEVASICLMIAIIALFMAIILTLIHYMTGILAGFTLGLAAGTHAWWPMLSEYAHDVLIPLAISGGALVVWALAQLYERFEIGEVVSRF